MVSFLLIISFILHIVTIVAIYSLFQQLQTAKNQDTQDIMDIMEVYLQEIKEENNRLQSELQQEQEYIQEKTNVVKQQEQSNMQEEINAIVYPKKELGDTIEASLESRVLQLHAEGLAVNDIARKLDCGKTEAEIIIKLYEKNKGKA